MSVTTAEKVAARRIVPVAGLAADPERRALDTQAADDEPITAGPDGELCGTCRGHGLVRGVGKNAGKHYRTSNGAQAALAAGRAVDCTACEGTGVDVPAPF